MKTVCFYLFLLFSSSALASSLKEKNDTILKKVVVDFITVYKKKMNELIALDSIDNMIIKIKIKSHLRPVNGVADRNIKNITYPDMDLYSLYFINFYFENEVSPPPSRLFYIEGYPVMLYDPDIRPMDSKDIPEYLRKNDNRWGGDDEWLVGICKKTKKYVVVRDSYIKADDTIKELNAFSCEDSD